MLTVGLLDGCFADCFSCLPDSAGRLHARDGGDQARAGNPEARRHLARPLVLDNTREAGGGRGGEAGRARRTGERRRGGGGVVGGGGGEGGGGGGGGGRK